MDYALALKEIYRVKKTKEGILSFRGSGLLELPREIEVLQDIIILNLSGNKLRTLPKEIGKLKNLKILYVDNNCLEYLPEEIGKLNLQWLTLSNNNFKRFPERVLYNLYLNGLQRIDLANNPITNIPKEFLHEEPREHGLNLKMIINYFIYNHELLNQSKIMREENMKLKDMFSLMAEVGNSFNIKRTNEVLDLKNLIIDMLLELQGRLKMFESNANENKYNDFLVSLLNKGDNRIIVKDQSRWGQSSTGKSPGSTDIMIFLKESNCSEKLISICECLKLSYLDCTSIENHLSKLFTYDMNGLKENFIIVYYTSKSFVNTWKGYIDYVSNHNHKHPLIDKFRELDSNCTDIKVGYTKHNRHDKISKLYHIFVNMSGS